MDSFPQPGQQLHHFDAVVLVPCNERPELLSAYPSPWPVKRRFYLGGAAARCGADGADDESPEAQSAGGDREPWTAVYLTDRADESPVYLSGADRSACFPENLHPQYWYAVYGREPAAKCNLLLRLARG